MSSNNKMQLRYKGYVATADGNGRFDLIETKTIVDKDTKKPKDIESFIGYSYTFEQLVCKVISLETAKKRDITTFREYIDECRRIQREILQILKP